MTTTAKDMQYLTEDRLTQTQCVIEARLVELSIESNHLVDQLLEKVQLEHIVETMQRRYSAVFQTMLAYRHRIDALESVLRSAVASLPTCEEPEATQAVADTACSKYRILAAGELYQAGDQWRSITGDWLAISDSRLGSPVPWEMYARRPLSGKENE